MGYFTAYHFFLGSFVSIHSFLYGSLYMDQTMVSLTRQVSDFVVQTPHLVLNAFVPVNYLLAQQVQC